MKKDHIVSDIQSVISELEALVDGKSVYSLIKDEISETQYLLSKTFSCVDKITGINKHYLDEVTYCIQASKRNGGIAVQNILQLIGQLRFLKDATENDWIVKFQFEIEGNGMLEFLQHSINYVDENQKIESSIISTALFEDTIRKIGVKHTVQNTSLEQILNALKQKGIFSKTFVKKMKYYADVRNNALHANWTEFELDDIKSLNSDLICLIEDYIK